MNPWEQICEKARNMGWTFGKTYGGLHTWYKGSGQAGVGMHVAGGQLWYEEVENEELEE